MSKINLLATFAIVFWFFGTVSAHADNIDSVCNIKQCHVGQKVWIEGGNRNDAYFACETSQLSDYTNGILGFIGLQMMMGLHPDISQETGEPVYQDGSENEKIITFWRQRAGVNSFYQAEQRCRYIVTRGQKLPATIISIPDIHHQNKYIDNAALIQVSGKHGWSYWLPYGYLNAVR